MPKRKKSLKHLVHIGKKAPKGWKEVSAMHLGRGIWAITCEKELPKRTNQRRGAMNNLKRRKKCKHYECPCYWECDYYNHCEYWEEK